VSKARIIIGKVLEKDNIDYVKAASGKEEDLVLELSCSLTQGNYIAFLQIDWVDPQQISSFVVSAFSD